MCSLAEGHEASIPSNTPRVQQRRDMSMDVHRVRSLTRKKNAPTVKPGRVERLVSSEESTSERERERVYY